MYDSSDFLVFFNFVDNLDRAIQFVDANPTVCEARAILIYAWNEHDEGGWLSPTWRENGEPDTSRLDAIRTVLREKP